jgi:hypothetical protein
MFRKDHLNPKLLSNCSLVHVAATMDGMKPKPNTRERLDSTRIGRRIEF